MRKIKVFPDAALKQQALPVEQPANWNRLVAQMKSLVKQADGIGLAAPQVGVNRRIFLLQGEAGEGWEIYFNPEITELAEPVEFTESCLSFPGVVIRVERGRKVIFRAIDESGNPVEKQLEGLRAQCVQHEIDHLDGITLYDHASFTEKVAMSEQLKNYKG